MTEARVPRVDGVTVERVVIDEAIRILSSRPEEIDDMGHSEYDAGWVARVPAPGGCAAAFPEVVEVVRQSQRADGSWGPSAPYASARLICTLSSMLALLEFEPTPSDAGRVARAAEYVVEAWGTLGSDPELTAGFELLAAGLLEELSAKGIVLQEPLRDALAMRSGKLSKVPADALYSPNFSIGNALEFLGRDVDVDKLRALQKSNGSINASVATTAYFARLTNDAQAMTYLRRCIDDYGPSNVPYGTPAYLWASMWVLHALRVGGILSHVMKHARPYLDVIRENVAEWGLSWSKLVEYGDADDTAIGFSLLAISGHDVDWSRLTNYKRGRHFITYRAETHPSVSANAHVLMAANECGYSVSPDVTSQIVDFLRERRVNGAYWTDKWHSSPYYATSRVVRPLLRHDPSLVASAIRWIIDTRHTDGSWGFYGPGTAEETAYCIHALAEWQKATGEIVTEIFRSAREILEGHLFGSAPKYEPRLWMSKTLYCPRMINRASVLAAYNLCLVHDRGD